MAKFTDKISNLIESQAPEFVLSDHPKFLEFVKTYFTFMESAQIILTDVQTTDGIQLETETAQTNNLILNSSKLGSDRTLLDAGDKILLEDSTYGDFIVGETITGQTSNATATVLASDIDNNKLYISAQDKFKVDETIVGADSSASATLSNYRPNPVNSIKELINFRDPDKVIASFLSKFRKEFLHTIPETLDDEVDKRKLIKNIKSLYRSKGSSVANEIFFRMLFNETAETIYPRENILRTSDGNWNTSKILRAIATVGDTSNLVGRTITGQSSEATAIVENVFKFQIGANEVSEFILNEDTISGTFTVGEEIRGTATDDDDTFIKASITGLPKTITINNDGSLYNTSDSVALTTGGVGGNIQVDGVGRGSIEQFFIENGGSGYEIGDDIEFTNTDTGGGSATAKVSVVNGGIAPEAYTTGMDATDHIVLEDETTRGDPYTGNKIVQEADTGTGDITDIRIINAGSNYLSLPKVEVDDTNGSSATVFAYSSQIGRILSLKVIEPGSLFEQSPTPPTLTLPIYLLVTNRSGSYTVGETVSATGSDGSTSVTGTFVSIDTNTNIIKLSDVTGTFGTDVTLTGGTSGATATIKIFDQSTATATVGAVIDSTGSFLNEDGHISETTMKVQDSLYYQDFSYVIKVGRSINDWRDSFKKTVHSAGFYFTGQVDIQNQIDVQLRNITTINSGVTGTPIQDVLNTLFSTIFGRRLGTVDDGTTLRSSPQLGVDPDFTDSTADHFTANTRDITLKRAFTLGPIVIKERSTYRSNTTSYGVPVTGPYLKSVGDFLLFQNYANNVRIQDISNLTFTGFLNSDLDGNSLDLADFEQKVKTNFAIPSEILNQGNDSFDETGITFDSGTITFDTI